MFFFFLINVCIISSQIIFFPSVKMEDHKRKNKKRNQNKRPTADQIKKLQNTAEQRKDINGVLEEKSNGTTSAEGYEDSHEPDLKVEKQESVEANGHKKNKKKIKQQKTKPGENESDTRSENGHIGQQVEHDHTNSNGVIPEAVIEKEDDDSQTKTKPASIDSETVAAVLETLSTQRNENHACSHPHSGTTSSCHQYHGDEAPTCSHHIQHHMSNINMGDLKIDFDVQKHLSPMSSPIGSNKEYFYKGFNVEQLDLVATEAHMESDRLMATEKIVQNNKAELLKQNDQFPIGNVDNRSGTQQPRENTQLPLDPKTLLKSMFGSDQHQVLPFEPDEMMKSMFGSKEGEAFNPHEMLKNMFGGGDNAPFNPNELFSSLVGREKGPANLGMNSPDSMENVLHGEKNSGAVLNTSDETMNSSVTSNSDQAFNPQVTIQSMFGGVDKNTNVPLNPNDLLRTMFEQSGDKGSINSNPARIFEAMLGAKADTNHTAPDPDDLPIIDNMFNQMNVIAQQMDPNMISGMSQIVAKMDPAFLMGVNNMVSSMMQGKGLDLQNLMQMKAKRLQQNKAELVECDVSPDQQKLDSQEDCLNQNDQNSKTVMQSTETNNFSVKMSHVFEGKYSNNMNTGEKAKGEEGQLLETINSSGQLYNNEEKTEPVMKCNFSFSSNTSEPTEESNTETPESTEQDDSTEKDTGEPKKVLRFVRDESIPELLENLTKTDTNKEVTTDRIEIKTSKFKAIINKVLKKEKRSVNGNVVSSIEVHEQRVEYQNNKGPSKTHKKEIDYEKLQHVKEPLEIRGRKETPSKGKEIIKKRSSEQNKNEKAAEIVTKMEKKSGESNKEDIKFIESTEQMIIDDNVEFNLESMNEIFTNLLQGRKMTQKTNNCDSNLENDNSNGSPGSTSTTSVPFEMIMKQNMSNLFNNLMGPDNPINKAMLSNETQNNPEVNKNVSNQNPADLFQNLQQVMMKQFASKNQDGSGPSEDSNIFESMTDMFGKMLPNKDENAIPDFQEFFSKQGNMTDILKMGEMLFGTYPIDHPTESSEGTGNTKEQIDDCEKNSRIETNHIKNEDSHENATTVPISKNVHQNDRTSVLLKQLLGDKFWSIRKKDNVLKENNAKSKSDKVIKKSKSKASADSSEIKTTESSVMDPSTLNKVDVPSTSTETLSLPVELQLELEKESPLVRMLHKRIQKDTKLQQFLKEKLKKDPKMQKFIQDRLQKDERIQKFMREKLSNDKALRQSFEEKFKNELGLTNIVPKFDDEEETNQKPSNDNNEEEKKTTEKIPDKKIGSEANKAKKDKAKTTAKKIHTGILFKTYAELTCLLVAIVYTAILCY